MKIFKLYTSEKQLITKAAKGDRSAQRRLYEQFSPKMLSVCRQYIKDVQFAEDAMVNGFVKVFKYLDTFEFKGSFEGWIRRIVIRECITFLRQKQFVVYDDEVYDKHEGEQSTAEFDVAYIQDLIDDLPPGYKMVFVLYVVEGYKHHEIAKMLEITESTSRSQLLKARRLLQTQLTKQNIIGYGAK